MFLVFFHDERGVLTREDHPTERAASERVLKLRRLCGIMAWLETDLGDYRWVA